jgi:hypothetical protein
MKDDIVAEKRGFSPEEAPITFLDAIDMTRRLGIR